MDLAALRLDADLGVLEGLVGRGEMPGALALHLAITPPVAVDVDDVDADCGPAVGERPVHVEGDSFVIPRAIAQAQFRERLRGLGSLGHDVRGSAKTP